MNNKTKKNLNNLISMLNNTDILKELINQNAGEEDIKYILNEFKEGLNSKFANLL